MLLMTWSQQTVITFPDHLRAYFFTWPILLLSATPFTCWSLGNSKWIWYCLRHASFRVKLPVFYLLYPSTHLWTFLPAFNISTSLENMSTSFFIISTRVCVFWQKKLIVTKQVFLRWCDVTMIFATFFNDWDHDGNKYRYLHFLVSSLYS